MATTAPQPDPPPAAAARAGKPDPVPPERPPGRWFVRAAIVSAVVGTAVMVAAIGWRWYHVRFPDAAIFVRGDASVADALVVVDREDGTTIFSDRLRADNQYSLVVLVEQGVFDVRAERDGRKLLSARGYVRNGGGVLLEVKPDPAATRPAATQPAGPPPAATQPAATQPGVLGERVLPYASPPSSPFSPPAPIE